MKKLTGIILAAVMAFGTFGTAYAADVSVMVDDTPIVFTDAEPFIDENGRTLVPLRAIAEAMNLTVEWNDAEKTASFSAEYEIGNETSYGNYFSNDACYITEYKVNFTVDSDRYSVDSVSCNADGSSVESHHSTWEMKTSAVIKDDRIYAPIRYLADEFGYTVVWDETTFTAWLTSGENIGHQVSFTPVANNDVLSEVEYNIEMLNSCILEIFDADVDFDLPYSAVYESEESYDSSNGEPALLYGAWESIDVSDYYEDPTAASYYPVSNYKTNAEVRENLQKYMSDEIIDKYFNDDFLEYDGALYLCRSSRGYGAIELDLDSLTLIQETDDKCYVSVDILYFESYDSTEMIELTKTDNGWIITGETAM